MAERRMFAKAIIDSDSFLEMPATARLLYYDLSMRADDDGFVNSPKKIIKMIGASPDDLTVLMLRKFVISFDSGVVVIKHWRINNYLQKDRYKETLYQNEKGQLKIKENKSYTLVLDSEERQCIQNVYTEDTEPVYSLDTQVSIGKVSIGKNSKEYLKDIVQLSEIKRIGEQEPVEETVYDNMFNFFWKEYPRKSAKLKAKQIFCKKIKPSTALFRKMMDALVDQKLSRQWKDEGGRYIPLATTWLNGERWNDELPKTTEKAPPNVSQENRNTILAIARGFRQGGMTNDVPRDGTDARDN